MYLQFQMQDYTDFCQPLHVEVATETNSYSEQYGDEMIQFQSSPVPEYMEYSTLQPVVHPALIGMNSSCQDSLNAGYNACADEAIRYLIEEEHFAPDDPIVVGLQDHLREQQRLLSLQYMFEQYNLALNSSENESINDSGVSLNSQSTDSEECIEKTNFDSTIELDDDIKQNESGLQNVNMAAITSLAEEILSLLEEGESLSDVEDENYPSEQ
ncbi:uncharacterized protein LOC143048317 isoform X1 [Mytilus galloprovincialis]|uniref:uncharacterized protein LOC143048317 isoform X1 n=2 Tax=Mytilus galloprovincialis TaxID=29158 RepID=UPI003F7C681C